MTRGSKRSYDNIKGLFYTKTGFEHRSPSGFLFFVAGLIFARGPEAGIDNSVC